MTVISYFSAVFSGQTLSGAEVAAGGNVVVYGGGKTVDIVIDQYGRESLYGGAVAIDTTISAGVFLVLPGVQSQETQSSRAGAKSTLPEAKLKA